MCVCLCVCVCVCVCVWLCGCFGFCFGFFFLFFLSRRICLCFFNLNLMMHSTLFNQRFPYTDIQLWTGTTTGSQGAHPGWMCMDLPLGTALTYRVNHSSRKLSTNSSTFRLGCFSPSASDFIVIGVVHWKHRNVTQSKGRKCFI